MPPANLAALRQYRQSGVAYQLEDASPHRLIAMLYDGAALGVLRALHREAVKEGRDTPALRGVWPTLAKALEATGMDAQFPLDTHRPFPTLRALRRRPEPSPMPSAA